VGNTATFTVNRQGTVRTLNTTIALRPEEVQLASNNSTAPATPQAQATRSSAKALGMDLSAITPEARRTYSLDADVKGVVITNVDPDSDAADKIAKGDVVLRVDNRVVQTPQDMQRLVAEVQKAGRKSVLLLVSHEGRTGYIAIDFTKT
jgi:serine protease Do